MSLQLPETAHPPTTAATTANPSFSFPGMLNGGEGGIVGGKPEGNEALGLGAGPEGVAGAEAEWGAEEGAEDVPVAVEPPLPLTLVDLLDAHFKVCHFPLHLHLQATL